MPPKRPFFSKRKTEITFDPEARRDYLQGFSERKKQRRAYGLAMQKVKDRKAKLEKRAERKEALKEQMEQAEKQKAEMLESMMMMMTENDNDDDEEDQVSLRKGKTESEQVDTVKTYQDPETQLSWGGQVIVRTSTKIPGDSSEDDDVDQDNTNQSETNNNNHQKKKKQRKGKDEAQEYAGNVERFIQELKGNMPGKKKKKKDSNKTIVKTKGKHGAAKMKGMGGTADLKTAQRILKQAQTKKGKSRRGR